MSAPASNGLAAEVVETAALEITAYASQIWRARGGSNVELFEDVVGRATRRVLGRTLAEHLPRIEGGTSEIPVVTS
jgi:hypothetical protein